MDFLKKILPIGSTVYIVVCDITKTGTKKVKFIAMENNLPTDITYNIAQYLKTRWNDSIGLILTTDPDNLITTLAINLHNDHNALKTKTLS